MAEKIKAINFPVELLNRSFIPTKYRNGEGNGFIFAGTTLVDICVPVDRPPAVDSLVYATGPKVRATGGLALNNAIAMSKLDPRIKVMPVGMIGGTEFGIPDSDGKFIINIVNGRGMTRKGLRIAPGQETAYTDIPVASGKKMFIHGFGACEKFGVRTFPFGDIDNRTIVLLGYLNLLPALMAGNGKEAEALVMALKKQNNFVGIDFTDIYDNGFEKLFSVSAGNADFIVTNEMSIAKGVGINVYNNGELDEEKLLLAVETVIDSFQQLEWIAIHWPKGGMFYTNNHQVLTYPVHELLQGDYVGTPGAGDNWAVGFLAAAFMGKGPLFALHLATTAAAKSLGALSATDASGSLAELKEFDNKRKLYKMNGFLGKFYPEYPEEEVLDWNW